MAQAGAERCTSGAADATLDVEHAHRHLTDWLGVPFDPEAFDAADFAQHPRGGRSGALDD